MMSDWRRLSNGMGGGLGELSEASSGRLSS